MLMMEKQKTHTHTHTHTHTYHRATPEPLWCTTRGSQLGIRELALMHNQRLLRKKIREYG